jgi:DNA gyrase subunit A
MDEYPRKGRGTKGVISIRDSGRNGGVTAALAVGTNDEIMLMTDGGKLVRTRVAEVSVLGRNTQGVKLIRLVSGEHLAGVERVIEDVGDNGYEDDAE